jgi:hypothetical protein
MSILKNIASLFSTDAPAPKARSKSGLIRMPPIPPATRYVMQLLESMLDERREGVTLRQSEALPSVRGHAGADSATMPQFSEVVNRLKFLARLNPVTYPDGTEAEFSCELRSRPSTVHLCFHDSGSDPACTIRVRRKEP